VTRADLERGIGKEIERAIRRIRGRVRQIAKDVDLRVATGETPSNVVYQALLDITPSFEASRVRLGAITHRRTRPTRSGQ
jgi:ribosomal protein S7